MTDITQNAQWVKPLYPGDIPQGTRPVWNIETSTWEFLPLEDLTQMPPEPTLNT